MWLNSHSTSGNSILTGTESRKEQQIRPFINFIKTIDTLDAVTDCIPLVSTAKNISIRLYQECHKVNETANPVQNSVIDDLKMVALTKSDFCWCPIIDNLVGLGKLIINCLKYCHDFKSSSEYADKKSLKRFVLSPLHGAEVRKLYLARNPQAFQALKLATKKRNDDAFA